MHRSYSNFRRSTNYQPLGNFVLTGRKEVQSKSSFIHSFLHIMKRKVLEHGYSKDDYCSYLFFELNAVQVLKSNSTHSQPANV